MASIRLSICSLKSSHSILDFSCGFETKLSSGNNANPLLSLPSSVRTVPATDAQQREESPPCPHTWEPSS